MKKLNKVASLFATAALASSFTAVSAQTVDNWVSGTGLPWKNGTNELCWRDGVWTPATGLQGCDGVPPPQAEQVTLVRELGRRSRLGLRALVHLRLGRSVRYLDLELDQELHYVLLPLGTTGAPPPAASSNRFTASS